MSVVTGSVLVLLVESVWELKMELEMIEELAQEGELI